jgi:hypothetical protein
MNISNIPSLSGRGLGEGVSKMNERSPNFLGVLYE